MSHEEIKSIQEQLANYHDEHTKAHGVMMDKINDLEVQLKPIMNIYQSMEGFGSVVTWIAKFIITPLIIILGAFLTIKNLHK